MGTHIDRAMLLLQQSRYDLAENELRQALGEEPNDAVGHALLALCLSHSNSSRGRPGGSGWDARDPNMEAALVEAEEAVGLAPDLAFTHYALASVLAKLDRNADAAVAIEAALDIDPTDADYYQLLAVIRLDQGDAKRALDAAEQGLEHRPDHTGCVNVKAMALVRLGRKDEANLAIAGALAESPDDTLSHANQGWTLLHQGQPRPALDHFQEALRIDPTNDWAKAGVVEALKARHLIYRLMLGFFLWTSRIGRRAQWLLVFGLLFGQQMLHQVAAAVPQLDPFVMPLFYAIFGFTLLTWLADPLFNLILRFNRFGRLALVRSQIVASNGLAVSLLLTAVLGLWTLVTWNEYVGLATFVSLVLSVCVCATFRARQGWPRLLVATATVSLYIIAGAALRLAWLIDNVWPPAVGQRYIEWVRLATSVVPLGVLAITLGVNFLPRATRSDD
ncbi:MAG: tetratricopeptide repeat protein [Gemmataceae bacterium]